MYANVWLKIPVILSISNDKAGWYFDMNHKKITIFTYPHCWLEIKPPECFLLIVIQAGDATLTCQAQAQFANWQMAHRNRWFAYTPW